MSRASGQVEELSVVSWSRAGYVSLDDLKIIEQHQERQGLAAVAGTWDGFEEVVDAMGELASLRQAGGGRKPPYSQDCPAFKRTPKPFFS